MKSCHKDLSNQNNLQFPTNSLSCTHTFYNDSSEDFTIQEVTQRDNVIILYSLQLINKLLSQI